jgi:hypothetical protein
VFYLKYLYIIEVFKLVVLMLMKIQVKSKQISDALIFVNPFMDRLIGGVGCLIVPIVHYFQIIYIKPVKSPKQ